VGAQGDHNGQIIFSIKALFLNPESSPSTFEWLIGLSHWIRCKRNQILDRTAQHLVAIYFSFRDATPRQRQPQRHDLDTIHR
jgi:hypothetical protein